jgi:hypothetical protein
MTPKRERADFDDAPSSDSKAAKKLKRKGGKACVYCRRRWVPQLLLCLISAWTGLVCLHGASTCPHQFEVS